MSGLLPSPDHPIHRLRAGEFATLIEQVLLKKMMGGQDKTQLKESQNGTVRRLVVKPSGEKFNTAGEILPDDPMGPPLQFMASTSSRLDKAMRRAKKLKVVHSGGLHGVFHDLHSLFLSMGAHYGALIDNSRLGNDPAQQKRITSSLEQWYDQLPNPKKLKIRGKHVGDYPEKLAFELAKVKKVPVTFVINNKKRTFLFDNIATGNGGGASLAHLLLAIQKNSEEVLDRPKEETEFISGAIGVLSGIVRTMDKLNEYFIPQLRKRGISDPAKVLRDTKLIFDSEWAEHILLAHAPMLKLAPVISALGRGLVSDDKANTILALVGQQAEEIPPIMNAEHGARLIHALLNYFTLEDDRANRRKTGTAEKQRGLKADAIKTYVRLSAHERPFDVEKLVHNEEVESLLSIAEKERSQRPEVDRALRTLERAITAQHTLAMSSPKANSVFKQNIQTALGAARARGMNEDQFRSLIAGVTQQSASRGVSFSARFIEAMQECESTARKELPPRP